MLSPSAVHAAVVIPGYLPQGTIQAKLLLKQEKEQKQQALEEADRRRILEEKGVPEEHFLRRQRLEQFQNMLTLFKEKQKERKLNIVDKLLKETKASKRGLTKEVSQPTNTRSDKQTKVKRGSLTAPSSSSTLTDRPPLPSGQDVEMKRLQESPTSASDTEEPPSDTLHSRHVVTIVEPEIRGLWDGWDTPAVLEGGRGSESSAHPGVAGGTSGEVESSTLGGGSMKGGRKKEPSKAQLMIMKKAMEKLKRSKISKQIAAGREFKVYQ